MPLLNIISKLTLTCYRGFFTKILGLHYLQLSASLLRPICEWFFISFLYFQALEYIVKISEVDETEIFKICLEYWNSLSAELYRENPFSQTGVISTNSLPVPATRRQIYLPILTKVLQIFYYLKIFG